MTKNQVLARLLNISLTQVGRWRKTHSDLMCFLDSLTISEIDQIIKIGKISKLEIIKNFTEEELIVKLNITNKNIEIFNQIIENNFKRSSLVYLYAILSDNNNRILKYTDLINFLNLKVEPKNFVDSLSDSFRELKIDFSNDVFIRKGFAKDLIKDIEKLGKSESIDIILENKKYFSNKILEHLKIYN